MITKLKTLSAVMILSAAVATPAFAHATKHGRAYDATNLRRAYNQVVVPSNAIPQGQVNLENFGVSGRDPSRVGGWDPSLNPCGSRSLRRDVGHFEDMFCIKVPGSARDLRCAHE